MVNNNKNSKAMALKTVTGKAVVPSASKVEVPAKIKCLRCHVVKSNTAYSGKRLQDLLDMLDKDNPDATKKAYIVCIPCTNGNLTELLCVSCDKVKGKDAFSKQQRKNPDKAECWPCLEERLNTEAVGGASDQESDGSNDSGSDGGFYSSDDESDYGGTTTIGGTSTMTGDMSNLSITNGSTGGGVGLNGYTSKGSSTTGGGVGIGSLSRTTSASTSTGIGRLGGIKSNGLPADFNEGGYGIPSHLRKKGPASVASSDTSTTTSTSKFAKVKSKPQPVNMDAARRLREEEAQGDLDDVTVEDDEDSDDD